MRTETIDGTPSFVWALMAAALSIAALAGCSESEPVSTEPISESFELCWDQPTMVGDHEVEFLSWVIYEPAMARPGEPPIETAGGEYLRFVVDGEQVEFKRRDPIELPTLTMEEVMLKGRCLTVSVVDGG